MISELNVLKIGFSCLFSLLTAWLFNFEAKYHKLLQESVNRIELFKKEDERLKQEIILVVIIID